MPSNSGLELKCALKNARRRRFLVVVVVVAEASCQSSARPVKCSSGQIKRPAHKVSLAARLFNAPIRTDFRLFRVRFVSKCAARARAFAASRGAGAGHKRRRRRKSASLLAYLASGKVCASRKLCRRQAAHNGYCVPLAADHYQAGRLLGGFRPRHKLMNANKTTLSLSTRMAARQARWTARSFARSLVRRLAAMRDCLSVSRSARRHPICKPPLLPGHTRRRQQLNFMMRSRVAFCSCALSLRACV